jgi:RecA-family ATPase
MSQYNKLYTAQDSAVVFIDHQSRNHHANKSLQYFPGS